MASTQLCIQHRSFLLPSRACVDTPLDLPPPPNRCSAHPSAKHGVSQAALAAGPSTEGSTEGTLKGLLQDARMQKGRAATRAWWYAQQLQKAEKEAEIADLNYAQAEAFARRMEMEEGRAVMRFWWLDRQLRALDPSRPPPPPLTRTRSSRPPGYKRASLVSKRQAVPTGRQGELGTAPEKSPAPSEPKTIITKDTARARTRAVPLDELVSIEVRKEGDAARRKALEAQAEKRRKMDLGRAAMRKWWVREREATKRALGLPPYRPVWTVVRKDGKGPPVSVGKMPLVVGSDVSKMEKVVPVQLDYPTVSRVHAKIFGKEVLSYGEYVREYFVVDLKSTNGVRLNATFRLRPGDEYRLSDGDTLFLGEEAATLIIKNPQRSP